MKTVIRSLFLFSALFAAAAAFSADMAGIDVVAKTKPDGKVVYQGKTDAAGKFSTNTLAPGAYVLELRSKKPQAFQVALTGPKRAKQFKLKGGVAFDMDVSSAAKVGGKVIETPVLTADQPAPKGMAKVKVMNGKRYVWVGAAIGSNMGGKWIPEEDAVGLNPDGSRRAATETLRNIQDQGGQGAAVGR